VIVTQESTESKPNKKPDLVGRAVLCPPGGTHGVTRLTDTFDRTRFAEGHCAGGWLEL
jgi:hypothetical protein